MSLHFPCPFSCPIKKGFFFPLLSATPRWSLFRRRGRPALLFSSLSTLGYPPFPLDSALSCSKRPLYQACRSPAVLLPTCPCLPWTREPCYVCRTSSLRPKGCKLVLWQSRILRRCLVRAKGGTAVRAVPVFRSPGGRRGIR